LRAAIADAKSDAPQFWNFDHFRIETWQLVVGWGGVVFEEIYHLGGDGIAKFEMEGFNDSVGRGAVSAAGVGEEEENVRFTSFWQVHGTPWGEWFLTAGRVRGG
jgi:hypothetical protein